MILKFWRYGLQTACNRWPYLLLWSSDKTYGTFIASSLNNILYIDFFLKFRRRNKNNRKVNRIFLHCNFISRQNLFFWVFSRLKKQRSRHFLINWQIKNIKKYCQLLDKKLKPWPKLILIIGDGPKTPFAPS